jgi:hypothetical protein
MMPLTASPAVGSAQAAFLLFAEVNNPIPALRRGFQHKSDNAIEVNSGQHIVRILVGERLEGIERAHPVAAAIRLVDLVPVLDELGHCRGDAKFVGAVDCAEQFVDVQRVADALRLAAIDAPEQEFVRTDRLDLSARENAAPVVFVQPLEAGGNVHIVSDSRVVDPVGRSDVAQNGFADVNAEPCVPCWQSPVDPPFIQASRCGAAFKRGRTGRVFVMGDCQWRIPEGKDRVADELVDRSIFLDD